MTLRKTIQCVDKSGAPVEARYWDLGEVYQKYEGQPTTYVMLFQVNGVFKVSVLSDPPADANIPQLRTVEEAACLDSFGIDMMTFLQAIND